MEINEEICPFKAGGYIYFQKVWLGHSKGLFWLAEWWACSLKQIHLSSRRQGFRKPAISSIQLSILSLGFWNIFRSLGPGGGGVKKSHLALNHSSVHRWNGACAITLSKIYKFKCILNELLKHGRLHHEEFDALLSNDNGIYVISLWVVIMVSFHRTAQIWAESSIILKLVFLFQSWSCVPPPWGWENQTESCSSLLHITRSPLDAPTVTTCSISP